MATHPLHHTVIWATIEAIAADHGLSASGLAKRAGLDVTAFNKSKRFGPTGIPRYPNINTIVKVLDTLNLDWVMWADYYMTIQSKIKG